jgi:hypothetical protein
MGREPVLAHFRRRDEFLLAAFKIGQHERGAARFALKVKRRKNLAAHQSILST